MPALCERVALRAHEAELKRRLFMKAFAAVLVLSLLGCASAHSPLIPGRYAVITGNSTMEDQLVAEIARDALAQRLANVEIVPSGRGVGAYDAYVVVGTTPLYGGFGYELVQDGRKLGGRGIRTQARVSAIPSHDPGWRGEYELAAREMAADVAARLASR
jgi:hypothetical protein